MLPENFPSLRCGSTGLLPIYISVIVALDIALPACKSRGLKTTNPLAEPKAIVPFLSRIAALVNSLSSNPFAFVNTRTTLFLGLNSTKPISDESHMLPKSSGKAIKNTSVGR